MKYLLYFVTLKFEFMFRAIITLLLVFCITSQSYSQTDQFKIGDKVVIDLKDNSSIHGEVMGNVDEGIQIRSRTVGDMVIPYEHIKKIQVLDFNDDTEGGLQTPTDYHNSTHYVVGPSAYGLRKGQSYYENIAIFWNSYTIGVTDNFSVSMGGEIISLLASANFPIVFVTPKFSFPFKNDSGAFAVSTTLFTVPGDDFNSIGLVTGSLTLGSRNNNATIGTGVGFSTSSGTEAIIPITVSGMFRIGPKLSFLTENWIITENDAFGILSAGLRIHFNKPGSAINVGLWRVTEDLGDLIALPYVTATVGIN